jgi:hypothetical protein
LNFIDMKRILLSAFLLLSVCLLHAQVPQFIGGPQGYQAEVFKAKKYLVAASFADTPTIPALLKTAMIGTIVLRMPVAGDTAFWGWIGYKWIQIGDGGGGGGAVSSVYGRTGAVSAIEADYSAFYPLLSGSYNNPSWLNQLAFSKLTGLPTSLAGYGITDPVVLTSGSYANPSWITSLAYSKLTGVPSFLLYHLIDGAANVGGGVEFWKDTSGNKIRMRTATQGYGIDVTQLTDNVKFEVDTLEMATRAHVKHVKDSLINVINILRQYDTATYTITDGATITADMLNGKSQKVTLGGNRTLALSNFRNGMFLSLLVIQDGTGSRTLTLPASTKVIGGGAGAVTLTTAANSHDVLTIWKINDIIYCNYGKNYN